MAINAVTTCPLGSSCEEIKDGKLHRCAWFVTMKGVDATGQEHDGSRCSMAWMPILQVEMAGTNRGQTAAINSLRNETVKKQTEAINLVKEHKNAKLTNI